MRRVWIGGIGLLVLALALPMCTGVPMTAPSNSSITLIANPTFVPANGGVSVVTAIVIEPAGTPVPNGTVVFFFTDLGSIDAEGKTKDGVARVNFVSDSRSGTATVRGVSGGVATPATAIPSASPTASPPSSRTPGQTGLVSRLFEMAIAHADAGTNSGTITIKVGSANPAKIIVVASPDMITSPGSALVTANVFDVSGNPIANVPVIFSLSATSGGLYETLDSGGAPQFTDTNGQAFDRVRTRAPIAVGQRTVTITATTPIGINGQGQLLVGLVPPPPTTSTTVPFAPIPSGGP
jgi:hypothetical protein